MIAKTSKLNLEKALQDIQEKYENNLKFYSDYTGDPLIAKNTKGTRFSFRLACKELDKAGHRLHKHGQYLGRPVRRSRHACWHVHGDFFDALFSIDPDAVIYSRGQKITKDQGNWEDGNIGSQMFPVYFSESCECN